MHRTIRFLTCCCALLLCAGVARGDDIGAVGTLVALQSNTTSADTFLQYNGRIFVKNENGTLDEYRWGGTSCGNRLITDEQLAMLQRALNQKTMTIEPLFQNGQGLSLRLVRLHPGGEEEPEAVSLTLRVERAPRMIEQRESSGSGMSLAAS
jgi:hypothetical protein